MMKGNTKLLVALALCLLQGCTLVASIDARASCAGVADGYYPLGQCVPNYYYCSGGTSYDLNCPSGTVFDQATTQCINSNQCITTLPTTTRKPFDCVGASDGNYAIGTSCSASYYSCLAGAMYPQTCPAGVFDPVKKQCVSSSSSSCAATTIAAGPTTTLAPGVTTTLATTTVPTTTQEATTTTSSPTTQTASTETSTSPTTTAPTTTAPATTVTTAPPATTPASYVCSAGGTFPIPGYCGPDYYSCSVPGASPTNSTCPNPPYNYFDSTSSSCLSCPQAACVIAQPGYSCPVVTTLPPPTPAPTTSPVICPAGSAGKFYQIKGYCGPNYYYCSTAGVAPSLGTCQYPSLNYFDCTVAPSGSCTGQATANCNLPTPATCINPPL